MHNLARVKTSERVLRIPGDRLRVRGVQLLDHLLQSDAAPLSTLALKCGPFQPFTTENVPRDCLHILRRLLESPQERTPRKMLSNDRVQAQDVWSEEERIGVNAVRPVVT